MGNIQNLSTDFYGIVVVPADELAINATIKVGNTGLVVVLPAGSSTKDIEAIVEAATEAHLKVIREVGKQRH